MDDTRVFGILGKGEILKERLERELRDPIAHNLTPANTDRLKAEVAHYNPNDLNPEEMLNAILEDYFHFARKVRSTGK